MNGITLPKDLLQHYQDRLSATVSLLGAAELGGMQLTPGHIETTLHTLRTIANEIERFAEKQTP